MSQLISIDPGVNHLGIAKWKDGELVEAFLWNAAGRSKMQYSDIGADAPYPAWCYRVDELVIESPVVYTAGKKGRRGDQNDLIDLAVRVGWVIGMIQALSPGVAVTRYRPSDWKGSLPKSVCHRHVKAALSPEELSCIYLPGDKERKLDVWDAVGIGLFRLCRAPWRGA